MQMFDFFHKNTKNTAKNVVCTVSFVFLVFYFCLCLPFCLLNE